MAYQPTFSNPYKWYKINKETILKGFSINEFYVCIYQYYIAYIKFDIENPYPIKTNISFRVYSNKEACELDEQSNKLDDFTETFLTMPFNADSDGSIGVAQCINEFLSAKYEVDLTQIEE
jgi:hypothetical protein